MGGSHSDREAVAQHAVAADSRRFAPLAAERTTVRPHVRMSFVVTVHVREGIEMAGDSRLTLTTRQQEGTLRRLVRKVQPLTKSRPARR
jgi:hypothetical protein